MGRGREARSRIGRGVRGRRDSGRGHRTLWLWGKPGTSLQESAAIPRRGWPARPQAPSLARVAAAAAARARRRVTAGGPTDLRGLGSTLVSEHPAIKRPEDTVSSPCLPLSPPGGITCGVRIASPGRVPGAVPSLRRCPPADAGPRPPAEPQAPSRPFSRPHLAPPSFAPAFPFLLWLRPCPPSANTHKGTSPPTLESFSLLMASAPTPNCSGTNQALARNFHPSPKNCTDIC